MNEQHEVSATQSAAFIGQLLWRSLGFALLGAVAGAIFGALNGVWSGGVLGLFMGFSSPGGRRLEMLFAGIQIGALWATCVGASSGAVALFIASLVAWRVRDLSGFANVLIRGAVKGATIGTALGAIVAVINYSLYAWFSKSEFEGVWVFYVGGVILGFILGTFLGAIRAALRQVQHQKEAEKAAALSTVEIDRTLFNEAK